MIKRLLLPVDNDDHMPPKEKSQPSESQIALLHWWITNGADFTKKVKDINQSEKLKPILLALQEAPVIENKLSSVPEKTVEKADANIIEKLKDRGIIVLPVVQNNNYLMANFVTDMVVDNEELRLLLALKKQLIWLKLGNTNLSDSNMAAIAQLRNLTRLSLEHTAISDKGVQQLKPLQNLQYLNLVGSKVTAQGVLQLKGLKELHSLFLYQTNVNKADWAALQNIFPETQIDSGGYSVAMLATDTTEVKAKKEN
jgi:Leucine-rich repeat (LRR) protein